MNIEQIQQQIPLYNIFEGLTPQDICDVANIIQYKTFREHDEIITEGDEQNKDLYLIVSGTVVAKISTQKEDSANINVMGKGQIFGELSLLTDVKRSATIEATSVVEIFCLSREKLENVAAHNNHVGLIIYKNIAKILADRIRNTNKLLKHTILWGW
ncbi:MAG: cyclic nucleotide-binding domain-containing protein [Candidatus Margulisbacteria bacterium]|nr:cyclic nucleotide-binding domain-containing protein [Candidatus Margulisiibacteriota bacterium]